MKKIDKILKELIKYTKNNEIAQLEILFDLIKLTTNVKKIVRN